MNRDNINWSQVADALVAESKRFDNEANLSSAKGFREGAIMFNTLSLLFASLSIALMKGLQE